MNHLSGLLRRVIKPVLVLFAALCVLAVLVIGVSVALLMVLWSLITGRKPAFMAHFSRVRTAGAAFGTASPFGRPAPSRAEPVDVVDVQAHEVRPVLTPPASGQS